MALEDFQEKKIISRIIYSLPVLIIIIVLVFAVIVGIWKAYFAKRELDKEISEFKKHIEEIVASRQKTDEKLSMLKTPEGIEREARARFNLKKSDEEVVIFVDEENKPIVSQSRAASIFNAIKNFFLKIF